MRRSVYPDRDYDFGQQVLVLRTESNLTQSGLAELLGVSRQAVVGWESGSSRPSSHHLKHLIELCLRHNAFHSGQEAEEIRAFWQNSRVRVPLDETWLTRLVDQLHDLSGAPATIAPSPSVGAEPPRPGPLVDTGDAPEGPSFYGRESELALLTDWLLDEHCCVVSILGMGGIGKSALAATLMHRIADQFDAVIWRSLRDAPPCEPLLDDILRILAGEPLTIVLDTLERRLNLLFEYLRTRRVLLVLDNLESVMEQAEATGRMLPGYEGYGRLLRRAAETKHRSCVLLTSRERPRELAPLEGSRTPVRSLRLGQLDAVACEALLQEQELTGGAAERERLIERYGGNPLALKIVAPTIADLFGGEIAAFLEQGELIFGSVRYLLQEQFTRLSAVEESIMLWLAILREAVTVQELSVLPVNALPRAQLLEALDTLRGRSLLEHGRQGTAFTLQPVVLEYMTERLVEEVVKEVDRGHPWRLVEQALILAQARDYLRQSQERLLGRPILDRLKAREGQEGAEQRLLVLLDGWRGRPAAEQGYGPGNVVNLLRLLRGDLRGLDLSRLAIRRAYLAEVDAQDVRLTDAYLADTVLADAFSRALAVALSADGALLAAGTSTGQVWVWRLADRTLVATLEGHTGQVFSVALAPDGRLLASGGGDGTVRLWDVSTSRLLATFEGHTGSVAGVALSANGHLLASGSFDGTVRLWETSTGGQLAILAGHTSGVWSVALSADGHLLASGSADGTVRLWESPGGRPMAILQGHTDEVRGVALSADGHLLASGSLDETVRLWEAPGGRPLVTMAGHTSGVWCVALSADGYLLASGVADGTVRLWNAPGRRPLAILKGHLGGVAGVALSADSHLVASSGSDVTVRLWEAPSGRPLATLAGSAVGVWRVALSGDGELAASTCNGGDGTVRLWQTSTGRPLATLQHHAAKIQVVALSADGHLLVSGDDDGNVQLWDAPSGQQLAILAGHTSEIWGIALSADGRLAASCSLDETVRLWDVSTSRLLATLRGHTGGVRVVALSADGHLLVSGGADGTLRLWETSTGRPLATLQGHTGGVRGVALSAAGQLMASGGLEGTVRLWEAPSGRPLATLEGHTGPVWGVALSTDGHLVASSSADGTVRLWDVRSGRPLVTLRGHSGPVPAVALSADGHLLASGGWDGTVRLWQAPSGAHVRTLRAERRYERMDIGGLTGITEAQRNALLALGAVDRDAPENSRAQ